MHHRLGYKPLVPWCVRLLTVACTLVAAASHAADTEPYCPASPLALPVAIESFDLPPRAGEPEMTVSGLWDFIRSREIDSIDELVGFFPDEYRHGFSLVEHTRATGQSNLTYPRVVLFGPDGRFLLNLGTKADDPKYDLLDVAQLHSDSGRWEFSVFDFSGEAPRLVRNDPTCVECHGDADSRPVWGTNLDWPGVFGDNVAPGPQGEALDSRHLERMRELIAGNAGLPRFDFLQWRKEPLRRGGKRRIAHHAFGVELILSNIAMGSASARGAYLRLRQARPQEYRRQRYAILYAYYARKGHVAWQAQVAQSLGLASTISADAALDSLLQQLGLDTAEAFSLATLASREPPDTSWSMGRGDLYDMLALQVLDELLREDAGVAAILSGRTLAEGVLDCPQTANTVADVVAFKMLHLFRLRGRARYQVNQHFYPLDLEDIYARVFLPVTHEMLGYLSGKLANQAKLANKLDRTSGSAEVTAAKG
ncbi:hypothetical protein [Microbulbifer sp. ALW1]|uniref:hypothetical protein n=1 Tax=Microbulbifer sp. (strain ALW1) TaxID=1516059 RepID=UPI00135C379A|nr:hypothetical protein [Microbulbifer sp. ALW1]